MSEAIKSAFESRWGLRLGASLGFGRDGEIYITDHNTAVKFFLAPQAFSRERQAYETLARVGITHVVGHAVPALVRIDEDLNAIEMTVVRPPFLLDFASAYSASEVPDFPENVWDEWRDQKHEEFGSRWPDVEYVLAQFRRLTGLVLLDVNPGNIRFANENSA